MWVFFAGGIGNFLWNFLELFEMVWNGRGFFWHFDRGFWGFLWIFLGVEIGFVFSGSETRSLALLDASAWPILPHDPPIIYRGFPGGVENIVECCFGVWG